MITRKHEFIIQTSEKMDDLRVLEGKTFQVHLYPDGQLKLSSVVILSDASRCPVIVNGVQCCGKMGHEGKHMWGSGD